MTALPFQLPSLAVSRFRTVPPVKGQTHRFHRQPTLHSFSNNNSINSSAAPTKRSFLLDAVIRSTGLDFVTSVTSHPASRIAHPAGLQVVTATRAEPLPGSSADSDLSILFLCPKKKAQPPRWSRIVSLSHQCFHPHDLGCPRVVRKKGSWPMKKTTIYQFGQRL